MNDGIRCLWPRSFMFSANILSFPSGKMISRLPGGQPGRSCSQLAGRSEASSGFWISYSPFPKLFSLMSSSCFSWAFLFLISSKSCYPELYTHSFFLCPCYNQIQTLRFLLSSVLYPIIHFIYFLLKSSNGTKFISKYVDETKNLLLVR